MVETDPINVAITADASDVVAGLNEGSRAMQQFGESSEQMSVHVGRASLASRTLFRGMIELRFATMATEHVLKAFGIQNETLTGLMNNLNLVMDVGITVLAIYRAASFLAANAHLAHAAAAFLAGIAEVSAATLFVGTAAAIGATLLAYEAYRVFSSGGTHLAQGGVVMPRSGVRSVTLAEAGEPDALVPLSKAREAGFGNGSASSITMNIYSNEPDYISRQLGRLI